MKINLCTCQLLGLDFGAEGWGRLRSGLRAPETGRGSRGHSEKRDAGRRCDLCECAGQGATHTHTHTTCFVLMYWAHFPVKDVV